MTWPLLISPATGQRSPQRIQVSCSGNVSNCPPQKNASKAGEKSHSTHGQCIDCAEPQKLASNRHPSHPFSGVLPRKIQYPNPEYPTTTRLTIIPPTNTNSCLLAHDTA